MNRNELEAIEILGDNGPVMLYPANDGDRQAIRRLRDGGYIKIHPQHGARVDGFDCELTAKGLAVYRGIQK